MPKSPFEPCIPTKATKVPDRPEWIHEIKHDGIVQREGPTRASIHPQRPRLVGALSTHRRGRFRIGALSFVIDGEAVLLGVDGVSDFNGCTADDEVEFYAFDMLVSDGEDIGKLPLGLQGQPVPAAGAPR